MFKVNYDEVTEFNAVIEEGNYEVFISKAEMSMSKSGREHIQLWFTVRNDIKQKFQNVIVFDRMWPSKETGQYQMWQIQAISKASNLENGKNYQSVLQWLEDLKNKPLIIRVGHQDFNDQPQPVVRGYYQSEKLQLLHQAKKENNNKNEQFQHIEIEQDDLPF